MTEVSFYVLPTESLKERYLFACKLIEKVYRSGQFCYVLTDDEEQSQVMDDLLWTFRAGSFIPHQIDSGELPDIARDGVSPGASATTEQLILIGALNESAKRYKTLFNLSAHYPDLAPQTERVLEILDNSETTKAAGRNRYRRYQQAGINITTHKDW